MLRLTVSNGVAVWGKFGCILAAAAAWAGWFAAGKSQLCEEMQKAESRPLS